MDKKLIQLFGLVGVLLALSACSSSESTAWTKNSSPWAHIRSSVAEAEKQPELIEPASNQEKNGVEDSVVAELESIPEEAKSETAEGLITESIIGGGILEIPASYYTVQLMASVDIDRVYKFADQNQLSIKYIVPTNRDGLIWHVLLLDVYPDRESAVLGKHEVEATLRTQPWIRGVGSIQQLMY